MVNDYAGFRANDEANLLDNFHSMISTYQVKYTSH